MSDILANNLAKTQTYDFPKNEGRKGYKKTKLGWIPEEWEIALIEEVFTFLNTNSYSRNQLNYSDDDGIYNIHYGDIHATYKQPLLDFEKERKIPKINNNVTLFQQLDFLKSGDLIIADASEDYEGVGEAIELKNLNGRKAVSGLHTFAFRDRSKKTSAGFRVYIFRNHFVKNALKTIATGSKVYGISKRNIAKFEIVLPSTSEQTAIATCLSTWDSAIATLTQLIEKKQQAKKGLMQQLLSGKKRLRGFAGEWKVKPLSSFIKYFPREVDKPNGTFHKLGIKSHCKGTFLNEDFDSEKIAIDKMYLVKENDLIVNITFAWEGAIAIINKDHAKTYVSHRFPTYTFKKDVGSPEYFKQFIQSKRFKYLLELISPGGAGRNRVMSKKDFLKLKITVPNYDEQTAIAQVLQTADAEIGLLTQKLERFKEQKKGLMQVLLTGRKRLEY